LKLETVALEAKKMVTWLAVRADLGIDSCRDALKSAGKSDQNVDCQTLKALLRSEPPNLLAQVSGFRGELALSAACFAVCGLRDRQS
jgi:hypothetical protein